jgi:hypothetical protein
MLDIDKTLAELANDEEPSFDEEPDNEAWDESFDEGVILSDEEVSELAVELANVQDEADLEEFIGNVFRRVKNKVGKFARSAVGKKLLGALKSVAKQALPALAGAAGTFIGGPLGGSIGSKIGGAISSRLEQSDEGAIEAAEQFVRFAAEAASVAAKASPSAPANAIMRAALQRASRRHPLGRARTGLGVSGRWLRRGNRIVLFGV